MSVLFAGLLLNAGLTACSGGSSGNEESGFSPQAQNSTSPADTNQNPTAQNTDPASLDPTTPAERWPRSTFLSRIRSQSVAYDKKFGRAIAISGNGQYMAAGSDVGGIEIFARDEEGGWRFSETLSPPLSIGFSGQFGDSLVFNPSGQRLIVGVPDHSGETYRDEFGLQVGTSSGAVVVYDRNAAGQWLLNSVITLSSYRSFDNFGQSVAISTDGRRIVASAPGRGFADLPADPDELVAVTQSGSVFVFEESGTAQFEQTMQLRSPFPTAESRFGSKVRMARDGSTLFVSVPGDTTPGLGVLPAALVNSSVSGDATGDTDEVQAGAVYVYNLDGNTARYELSAVLKSSLDLPLQSWGASMAINGSGNILVVGSTFAAYDDASLLDTIGVLPENIVNIEQGLVTLYKQVNNQWEVMQTISSPPTSTRFSNLFGAGVHLSNDGNVLAVGMPGYWEQREDFNSLDAGIVFIYQADRNGLFVPSSTLRAPEFIVRWVERLGAQVSITDSSQEVIASTSDENGSGTGVDPVHNPDEIEFSSGAVYTYELSN